MKNKKNNKNFNNENQKSFFFDDFLETTQKNKTLNKSKVYEDRLYILFSFFFSLILIFSISIFSISIQKSNFQVYKKTNYNYPLLRRDVVDRNGELMARNINSYHAAVRPSLIKNK
jgi:cell division protein FtsI/penicillin-binding protein 2